jgi:hypothetical protein
MRACVGISASSGLHSHPVSWPGLEPPDGDPGATHDLAQYVRLSRVSASVSFDFRAVVNARVRVPAKPAVKHCRSWMVRLRAP